MRAVQFFSLENHQSPYQQWPRQTRLFVRGSDTTQTVPGYVIEAQYQCVDGYLLITSQDCCYEESNDFLLLNQQFQTISKISLGHMYHSFLLEKHWPISDDALGLDYGGGLIYALRINKTLFGSRKLELCEQTR